MEIIILVLCIIGLIISALILLHVLAQKEIGANVARIAEQNRNNIQQNEAMRMQIAAYGQRTEEQVGEINEIVSEKMQYILDRKINEAFDVIVKNMNAMGANLKEGQDRQRQEIASQLVLIKEDNQKSLDKINDTVNEKLQKTLNDRISQSFEAVNQRLAEVYAGLGEMKAVASGVADLKNVLSNVKNRGIVGEIQLSAILSDILTPDQYEVQFQINPEKRDMVDFAVKLPGQEDGSYVYLPIDSKFPGDKWGALADAYDHGSAEEIKEKRDLLVAEIKKCAKSIHDKYICPPHSTDFALMFLPFEGLYAEIVSLGLVEELQRNWRINVTGPSTMAAMLNSLQMGFRTLAIQKKSGEVWTILEAAKAEFGNFEKVLQSARMRLRQADEDLDKLIGVRTRAINRKLKDVGQIEAENTEELLGIDEFGTINL